MSAASSRPAGAERALEQAHLLDEVLAERDGLLSLLDRVLTMRGAAALIRDVAGADAGFVADVGGGSEATIRWLSGTRTGVLQDLVVPAGVGIGGRVLAVRAPVRVSDYVSSSSITHQFDELAEREAMGGMLAVPITADGSADGEIVALAYAALRGRGDFGDDAVRAVEGVAAEASRALQLADRAAEGQLNAVAAERMRMQASLHDSVGALLFSIGAQVHDLRSAMADQPVLSNRLGRLESDVSAASVALREALLALSESSPDRALPVELAEHCRSFETRTGVPARFVQLGPIRPLDVERTTLLVGAVREGLLNVEKHADAATVIVSLGEVDGGVQIAVVDDGKAAPTDGGEGGGFGTGLGIGMLATRAARLGGRASVVHDEDGGTTLRVLVPCPH